MGEQSKYFDASDEAKSFIKDHIAVDSLTAPVSFGWPREEMFEEYHGRAIETGIDVIGITVSGGSNTFTDLAKQASQYFRHIQKDSRFQVVHSATEIAAAHQESKQAMFFNCQGCECLDNNPQHYMPLLKGLGVGTMALAYNERYRAGDGCLVPTDEAGAVTLYGKQVIDAMHEYGVILDLSHGSERTSLSAIEYSQEVAPDKPVVYTHSNPRRVYDFFRSISDAEAKACAATGGVVGIVTLPWFIDHYLTEETTPEMIVRAIDITVDLVGIDHVGISSDDTYCWTSMWDIAIQHPEWWQDDGQTAEAAKNKPAGSAEPAKIFPAVVDLLWKKGYKDEDIAKVMGENLMRIYGQVWT
ncbi:MAG: dipeptidase [Woeseiaceae bacterium]